METFVLSAVLSFVVYECLVYVDVPPRRGWFRIGDVSINFDAASAKWAHRALIAVIVFALLLSILFIHEIIFPLDRISRNKVNIILGLLFGPLFAIWLNSVFNYSCSASSDRQELKRENCLSSWRAKSAASRASALNFRSLSRLARRIRAKAQRHLPEVRVARSSLRAADRLAWNM